MFAGRLLELCWKFAGSCKHPINYVCLFVISGQEAAINVFSTIKRYINDQTIRKLVLPKAKSLFTKSTNVRVSFITRDST